MPRQKGAVSRIQELERCFKTYPDVPREVMVKDDVMRQGITYSLGARELINEMKGRGKRYYAFLYEIGERNESAKLEGLAIPEDIRVRGGMYNLKMTALRNYWAVGSPYMVDMVDGKLILRAEGTPIADVLIPSEPKYYSKQFEDGTLYSEVAGLGLSGHRLLPCPFNYCQYWARGLKCLFCDMNEGAKRINLLKKKRGFGSARLKPYIDPDQMIVAAKAAIAEGEETGRRVTTIMITGGTILTKLGGMKEDDFYLRYVEAFRNALGNRLSICLQTAAKDKETCKKYRDAGVTAHHANIEVWDERIFSIVCPGKSKMVGRENWIRMLLESVDVFGEGNVNPNLVAGVEMAKPFGFKDVASATKSTLEGIDFLMKHGVIPRPHTWCVSAGSALAGSEPPPLDYYVQISRGWFELWEKHRLPPPTGEGQMGPGRAWYNIGSFMDMGGDPHNSDPDR